MATRDASLAARFKRFHSNDHIRRLERLSFHQLSEMPIRFGQTKRGMTFNTVLTEDPDYCQWFLEKYAGSIKVEHVEFVFFLKLHVERLELIHSADLGSEEEIIEQREIKTASNLGGNPTQQRVGVGASTPKPSPAQSCWDIVSTVDDEMTISCRLSKLEKQMQEISECLMHLTQQMATR